MNILVTGAGGQLGSELRDLARKATGGHRFFFTDVAELDITDRAAVERYVRENGIGLLINSAAFTAVDRAETAGDIVDLLNHRAPEGLAAVMYAAGGIMLHVSTDYVFDGTAHRPYVETDAPCPASAYGRTKLAGEEAVLRACPDAVVVRTAWLYSTFGNNFVKTMLRLGRERNELGVVFDQVGTPTYARDLARALLAMVDKGLQPGVYHFTNEGVCSWYDFACEVHRLAGIANCRVRPLRTEEYPTPAVRPHYSVLDKTKVKRTYDLEIPWWQDALRECITRLEQHED